MPLAELQTALGTIVALQAAAGHVSAARQAALDALALTSAESDWLASLPGTRGFQVTCDIQRWWRETRLRETARLTLAALGAEQANTMLTAYLSAHLCNSLFFLPETLLFLTFVARNTAPHISTIAQFEYALLNARETAARSLEQEQTPPELLSESTIVVFSAPPEQVLTALLQGQPLPEIQTERFPVRVSPGLPHFWQPVTADEPDYAQILRA